jgi:prepilin-type N-terminal cleavage/methylation domain-containing protein
MRKRRTNGFTLIEMLVVLVIVGIMVGLAIPAVTNLMKSGGVSAASRHVSSTLSLARQYAITHRTKTRVIFPYSATTGVGLSQAPQYLTYAVVAKDSTSAGWAYVGKWEFLPLGVVFLKVGAGALNDPVSMQRDLAMPFPSTVAGYSNTPLAYIEFNPTGVASLAGASQAGTLTFQEGLIDGTGIPRPTSGNGATIVFDNIVGRIQLNRP